MKKWAVEIIWITGNIGLVLKRFFDWAAMACAPCPPGERCPPCQTEFMSQFWIYMTIFNALIVLVLIIKFRFLQENRSDQHAS